MNCLAPLRRHASVILLPVLACAVSAAVAAPPETKTQTFSGCVTKSSTEKDTLVLNTPDVCARLTGPKATPSLAGHLVDLRGILTPGTGRTSPALVQVESVTKTGAACSDVCSLLPPGKRGLGGERPGTEGGTPGLAPGGERPGSEGGTPGLAPSQPRP